jgi:hypothetical protein
MSTALARLALTVAVAASAACSASAPYGFHRATAAPYPSRDILGEAEIRGAHVTTAYEAIMRLRPTYVTWQRITTGNERRLVFVDGMLMGGLDVLRTMPAGDIHEVRLITAVNGAYGYALANSGGALLITTRVGPVR